MKQFFKRHLARKMKKKNQTLSSERLEVKVGAKWKLFLIDGEKKKKHWQEQKCFQTNLERKFGCTRT